jgi:urocanate hydratase
MQVYLRALVIASFCSRLHALQAREFAQELDDYGHIYMYRFIPDIQMK